jgi:hypothetical protein
LEGSVSVCFQSSPKSPWRQLTRIGLNSIYQARLAEVDQQSAFETGGVQVGKNLGGCGLGQIGHRLQLDYHLASDQHVNALALDHMPFVDDVYLDLTLNKNSAQAKLDAQRFLVDGFQQPEPKTR